MKSVADFPRIYLCRLFVDMRKQIQGLTTFIQSQMQLDPFADALFVFVNRRRDLMKCVYWDATGFAMWVKRLDQEKFIWPKAIEDEVIVLPQEQMQLLLAGYDVWKMKKHKSLNFHGVT